MGKKIVLATLGSLGDLHPFIAIALRLRERGYETVLATSPQHRSHVGAERLAFHPIGPSHEQTLRDLGMTADEFGHEVMKDSMFILEGAIFPYLQRLYDDLLAVIDGSALVLAGSLVYPASYAAARCATPHLTVALQPMVFVSAFDPPCVSQAPWLAPLLSKLGPRATRAIYGTAKRLASRRAGPLSDFRRALKLPRSHQDPLFEAPFSSSGTLATYSSLLSTVYPDYPPKTTVTGFTFYDGQPGLRSDLLDFLSRGPPPLVFTLGSLAVQFPGEFYRVSREVARRLQQRAVLLVGSHSDTSQNGTLVDDSVFVTNYARFSELLPLAAAIIHHGGIGTTGQALRAGKPQLVVPVLGDQFDNAARVVRLGVGRTLRLTRYTSRRVEFELSSLLREPRYAVRAAAVGGQVSQEDGAEVATRIVDAALRACVN